MKLNMSENDWWFLAICLAMAAFMIGLMYGLLGCSQVSQNPAVWCIEACGKKGIDSFSTKRDETECTCKE